MLTNGSSLKPGGLDSRVMALFEQVQAEGQMPALVEKFVERGEIDEQRFTPEVKRAMVEYLLDRGVQMNDRAVLDAGGYDEHFALAYEHALRRSGVGQDPIDGTRIKDRLTAGTLWDFTIDPFDEFGAQAIVKENILAAGAIDYIYEIGERLRGFHLMDACILRWSAGPIDGDDVLGQKLFRAWKLRDERSSPEERAMLYKRVLGKGDAKLLSRMVWNESCPGLRESLLSEIADYIDKTERLDEGRGEASPVSRSRIYQATRELQYNLTEFATGMAHMQARELYAQLQEALELLGDEQIVAHFGGTRRKGLKTVITELSKAEFGAAPNVGAIRSLAVDGNRIFQWIANFDPGTVRHEDFLALLEAGESYILNAALVEGAPSPSLEDKEDDDFDDFDDEESDDDDFGDF